MVASMVSKMVGSKQNPIQTNENDDGSQNVNFQRGSVIYTTLES